MTVNYFLALVPLVFLPSLGMAQSGPVDCAKLLEPVSDFRLITESEFKIEVNISDSHLVDQIKTLLINEFSGQFQWRIEEIQVKEAGQTQTKQVMEIKGFLTYLDINLARQKIARTANDPSLTKRIKLSLHGPEDARFNNHFGAGSHLISSRGQMKAGRYYAWISASDHVLRTFNEGRIVATDAKNYVLAHRDQFSETAVKFFESKSIEELEEMWHADGFRLGMRDARFLRLVLVEGMNKAKAGVPAFISDQLKAQGLEDVQMIKSTMGALFYVNFDIANINSLLKLTQGKQPLFDEILIETYAGAGQ